jgi:Family of unknown function (DUF5939)
MQSTLESRLNIVREGQSFPPVLVERLAKWVETAPEEKLYRINPLKWAKQYGVDENLTIDLFLRSAKAGIFDMVWSVLCTQCGMLITTPGGLRSLGRTQRQCRL